jgi:hypothetical protein
MALVEMLVLRLRLQAQYISASRLMDESEPTTAPEFKSIVGSISAKALVCSAENSNISASLFGSNKLNINDGAGLPHFLRNAKNSRHLVSFLHLYKPDINLFSWIFAFYRKKLLTARNIVVSLKY